MHECAGVHNAMSEVTKLTLSTSEQHIELGIASRKYDFKDFNLFLSWLNDHNLFDTSNEELKSLSTGMSANDKVNCGKADDVGYLHSKEIRQFISQ